MSNPCSELKQWCKRVREEVFEHLTAFESVVGTVVPQIFNFILAALSLFIAVIAVLISLSKTIEIFSKTIEIFSKTIEISEIPVVVGIGIIAVIASYFAVKMLLITRGGIDVEKFAKHAYNLHREALKKYVDLFVACCEDLRRHICVAGCNELCLDVELLKSFVKALETKSR